MSSISSPIRLYRRSRGGLRRRRQPRLSRCRSSRSGCRPGRSRPSSSSSVAISDRLRRWRPGCATARGDYMAVIAADLQEPPDLVLEFHRVLMPARRRRRAWATASARTTRSGRRCCRMRSGACTGASSCADMPKGGIDVFGCTRAVRDQPGRAEGSEHQPDRAAVLAGIPAGVRPLRAARPARRAQRLDVRAQAALRARQHLQLHGSADQGAVDPRGGRDGVRDRRGRNGVRRPGRSGECRCSATRR